MEPTISKISDTEVSIDKPATTATLTQLKKRRAVCDKRKNQYLSKIDSIDARAAELDKQISAAQQLGVVEEQL